MAQIRMPLSIWIAATSDERDSMLLSAGFDPSMPTDSSGTTSTTFVLSQTVMADAIVPEIPVITTLPVDVQTLDMGNLQPGDDLRDTQSINLGITDFGIHADPEIAQPVAGTALAIAGRALRLILGGGGGRLTLAIWNSLPNLVRIALTQVGIGVGAMIAFNGDIPFITLRDSGPQEFSPAVIPQVDIQIGGPIPTQLGVSVIGSWNTNRKNPAEGVTFYRLSNGWLAVQNKKGRWKTWKPKKPIVLYADGASNIKMMLRADRALARQAKKIATMLNRRAPRKKSSAKAGIIIESGPGNVIAR